MDTAIVEAPGAELAPAAATAPATAPTLVQRLAGLPLKTKLQLGAGVAALVAVLVALALSSSQTEYKVLFSGLQDKDTGAIVAQLSQLNIPYKHVEGGGALLVPADKVHDLRLKLASAGLPKGSVTGFELMDNARFGQTQFQERLSFQRGLEGELVRTISALTAVQQARVHLALPNQNGFFREQQKPSASVVLTLHAGRTLDRAQIAGIVTLVSNAVPELHPKAVSVLDGSGELLTPPEDANGKTLDMQQLQYVRQMEQVYLKRVQDILEPVVGRDNLRANVTAEVDFSQSDLTAEQYKPNQKPEEATVRSTQSLESNQAVPLPPAGVPGAASNTPPVPASAPITGQAQALQGAQGGGNTAQTRREAVTNYEVDKTVRVTRGATGILRRLNAAVVVNDRSTVDAKGKPTTVPLTPAELEKLTALVQESVGFKQDRGDSVRVINAPFRAEPAAKPDDTPLWKQPWATDLLRTAAAPAALVLLGLVAIFGLIRPALRAAYPPPPKEEPPEAQVNTVVGEGDTLEELQANTTLELEGQSMADRIAKARSVANKNPQAVAQIISGWMGGENS